MDFESIRQRFSDSTYRCLMALFCAALLLPGESFALAQAPAPQAAGGQEAPKIPNDQLDSLVAPIALYPDPMLAQVLAASTYPLEIIQLQQWLGKNPNLKDKALADAVAKQPWDPSVQNMAALPDVVKRLANDIQWTTDLGNAFLAQQADVMDAVQRMRKKAKDQGNLKTTEQQKVETQVIENKTVIVVQQANPQVVYVPTYNPVVVYGPPVYPYPPIVYPPPPPPGAYVATAAIAFGVGVAIGSAYHGGWGYGCGWGHNDVTINVNNNYNRNTNISNSGNTVNRGGNTTFQHNPQHRGGAPYANSATASKYGGATRGASPSATQANARQNAGQQGSRSGAQAGTMNSGGAARAGGAGVSNTSASRSGASGAGVSNSSASRGSASGGDRVGSRSVSSSPAASTRSSGAFGGASGGSGSSARASSSRGSSSMKSSRSGGGGGGRRR